MEGRLVAMVVFSLSMIYSQDSSIYFVNLCWFRQLDLRLATIWSIPTVECLLQSNRLLSFSWNLLAQNCDFVGVSINRLEGKGPHSVQNSIAPNSLKSDQENRILSEMLEIVKTDIKISKNLDLRKVNHILNTDDRDLDLRNLDQILKADDKNHNILRHKRRMTGIAVILSTIGSVTVRILRHRRKMTGIATILSTIRLVITRGVIIKISQPSMIKIEQQHLREIFKILMPATICMEEWADKTRQGARTIDNSVKKIRMRMFSTAEADHQDLMVKVRSVILVRTDPLWEKQMMRLRNPTGKELKICHHQKQEGGLLSDQIKLKKIMKKEVRLSTLSYLAHYNGFEGHSTFPASSIMWQTFFLWLSIECTHLFQ